MKVDKTRDDAPCLTTLGAGPKLTRIFRTLPNPVYRFSYSNKIWQANTYREVAAFGVDQPRSLPKEVRPQESKLLKDPLCSGWHRAIRF